jgi:hypothetical protein
MLPSSAAGFKRAFCSSWTCTWLHPRLLTRQGVIHVLPRTWLRPRPYSLGCVSPLTVANALVATALLRVATRTMRALPTLDDARVACSAMTVCCNL